MPTCRMASDKPQVWPTTVLGNVLMNPSESLGNVFNVTGMPDFRRQTIIGNDKANAIACKHVGDFAVKTEHEILVAMLPSTAMNEQDHGKGIFYGQEQIQFMFGGMGRWAIEVGHILNGLYLIRSAEGCR